MFAAAQLSLGHPASPAPSGPSAWRETRCATFARFFFPSAPRLVPGAESGVRCCVVERVCMRAIHSRAETRRTRNSTGPHNNLLHRATDGRADKPSRTAHRMLFALQVGDEAVVGIVHLPPPPAARLSVRTATDRRRQRRTLDGRQDAL